MIHIDPNPDGRRLYLWGHRCHHWHAGLAAIMLGCRVFWADRRDWPWRR